MKAVAMHVELCLPARSMVQEFDPPRYLPLLDDFTSRETARVRRNLGVLSVVVVLVESLRVPLEELRIADVQVLEG